MGRHALNRSIHFRLAYDSYNNSLLTDHIVLTADLLGPKTDLQIMRIRDEKRTESMRDRRVRGEQIIDCEIGRFSEATVRPMRFAWAVSLYMVGVPGLEPGIFCSQSRSILLRYAHDSCYRLGS